MTISSATSRITYTGNGSTATFAVPFYFATNSDLVVYLQDTQGNQTLQAIGTNYTLTGATLAAGGTCTFTAAPTTGYIVSIYRDPPATQTTSYNNNDPFAAKSHELALDKLTTLAQRVKDLASRSIHQTEGEASMTTTFAPVANRKNTLLGFGSSGELVYALGPTFVNGTYTGMAFVDTRSTAAVTTFTPSVTTIYVAGFAAKGDGGAGLYIKLAVTPVPVQAWHFQSADGAYWQLAENKIYPEMFGAVVGDGITDDAVPLVAWATHTCLDKRLLSKSYATTKKLSLPVGSVVTGVPRGHSKIVALPVGTWTGGATIVKSVMTCVGTLTALPALSVSPVKGAVTLTFASAPAVVAGDVTVLYDRVNSSFNPVRTYYRAGEYVQVSSIAGNVVTINEKLRDGYTAANMDMYKLSGDGVTIKDLEIVGVSDCNNCLTLSLLTAPILENVYCHDPLYAAINVERCWRPLLSHCQGVKPGTDTGNEYGCIIVNCHQSSTISGRFVGAHAGLSIGGDDLPGAVPNRDYCDFGSTFISTQSNPAFDVHGNSENIKCFGSTIINTASFGGKDGSFTDCLIVGSSTTTISPVLCSEMYGGDFRLTGCRVETQGTIAAGHGIIDLIGVSANTLFPVNYMLRNNTVVAPNVAAGTSIIDVGWASSPTVNLDIDGIDVTGTACTTLVQLTNTGGAVSKSIKVRNIKGLVSGAYIVTSTGWAGATDVNTITDLEPQSGIQTIAATTLVATVANAGSNNFLWCYPALPKVSHCIGSTGDFNGTKRPQSFVFSVTGLALRTGICTIDSTNFGANANIDVHWRAWL